jgi:4-hydroxyphenylacetate 3-monooxygenase
MSNTVNTKAGVRSGQQYLKGLLDAREVWFRGERVLDVTDHQCFSRGAHTLASLIDKQCDAEYRDIVTYQENGNHYGMAFKIPSSREDIVKRGQSFYQWALWSNGMFGRTPDYKNASVTAFAASSSFLEAGKKEYGSNMIRYYNYVKDNDKVLTHTLVNPTYSHAQAISGKYDEQVALHVKKETDSGIIVSGARLLATLGPYADEIEVFPSSILTASEDNLPFAFAFAIPISTPGLKLICRDSYDENKSHFDAPLASRFEEMDSVVIFNEVFVPWERVFLYRDPALCNRAFSDTNAVVHMMHQVACSKLAKSEFIVGLLCAMAEASGKHKDHRVKEQIAEVMMMTETIRALKFSAEQQAEKDNFGNYVPLRRPLDTCRNLFPKLYPRMIELVQMMGSSSLMATPCESDFHGELSSDVEKYFRTQNKDSIARVALFRLAQDVAVSGFGSRQVLYERFFFGPQHLMSSVYYDLYDKEQMRARVETLLEQGIREGPAR